MIDPLTALGVAGNVLQVIDFGFQLVSEGNKIYRSANGALEENRAAEDLAQDLHILVKGLSKSQKQWIDAHGSTQLDPDENRLRNICDRCSEIAVELQVHLRKLKVQDGVKFRRIKSYKQALISVWRKDQIDAIEERLLKYQREIDTHILIGLRKSAQDAEVKNTAQFAALDEQTKDLTLAVLEGDQRLDSKLSDQSDLLSRIHDQTSKILNTIVAEQRRSPPPQSTNNVSVKASTTPATPLHDAAAAGEPLKVRQLLRNLGLDVNARDEHGYTPLQLASTGKVAKRLLADKRIDVNVEDYEGRTALHCAVLKRRLDVIKVLLEGGIDQNLEDDYGKRAAFYARDCPAATWMLYYGAETEVRASNHLNNTGLIHMAWLGDLEGVDFFLRHNADVNATNEWGESGLTEAARHGSASIVEILIDNGASIEQAVGGEWTPLLQAIRDNREEVVRILLSKGANKEVKLKNGNTALAEACNRCHFKIAKILVEAGSKIDIISSNKRTPLSAAAYLGEVSFTRLLLSRGAQKEFKDNDGRTPVHIAAWRGHWETLEHLLAAGADANSLANDGFTALGRASQLGHYDCVKLLLRYGADINVHATNASGYTALAEAAYNGQAEVARALLEAGARWNIGSKSGSGAVSIAAAHGKDTVLRILGEYGVDVEQRGYGTKDPELSKTPLMFAAINGHASTVAVLAELGANLDAVDSLGSTALHYAATNNRSDCVKALIKSGANPNIQTNRDETALMKAAVKGSETIVQLLVEGGANLGLREWYGRTAWIFAIHWANDQKLKRWLDPMNDDNRTMQRIQAEGTPKEITAYMHEIYR